MEAKDKEMERLIKQAQKDGYKAGFKEGAAHQYKCQEEDAEFNEKMFGEPFKKAGKREERNRLFNRLIPDGIGGYYFRVSPREYEEWGIDD